MKVKCGLTRSLTRRGLQPCGASRALQQTKTYLASEMTKSVLQDLKATNRTNQNHKCSDRKFIAGL